MKEFIETLIEKLEEKKAEAENEMHRLRSGDYTLLCSYDITDIKEIASESFKEAIEIVNQLEEEYSNDFCEWRFVKSVADGSYVFSSGCNHKRFSDLHSFEYCPYCGKKIKVVK